MIRVLILPIGCYDGEDVYLKYNNKWKWFIELTKTINGDRVFMWHNIRSKKRANELIKKGNWNLVSPAENKERC